MRKSNLLFLLLSLALQSALTKSTGIDPPIEDTESATDTYTNEENTKTIAQRELALQHDLTNIFTEVLDRNWTNAHVLIELASLTPNTTVKWILYNILWYEIKTTKAINNPFAILAVVPNMKKDLQKPKMLAEQEQFEKLYQEMNEPLKVASAKKLEAVFYVDGSASSLNFPVLQKLLSKMQSLDDAIFAEIMHKVYDGIEDLVTPTQIAKTLTKFSSNTEQNVVAILKFLNRTSANEDNAVLFQLKQNLQELMLKNDFASLPDHLKQQVTDVMPKKFGVLETLEQVCIRHANTSKYLRFSNAHFTLDSIDLSSIFKVENGNDKEVAFLNTMQGSYLDMRGISPKPKYWQVRSYLDGTVSLLDTKYNFYFCIGSSKFKYNQYPQVFALRSDNWPECHWMVEKC